MISKLTTEERAAALPVLASSGWSHDEKRDAINRTFKFKNFVQAWSWMTAVALHAEKADHHPEWFNVYGEVRVTLTTHECDGLSIRDLSLARKMDALARG